MCVKGRFHFGTGKKPTGANWRLRPETVYAHALHLLALALEPRFLPILARAVSNIRGVAVSGVPCKTLTRMLAKMATLKDHR
jgi:hypothetical protein